MELFHDGFLISDDRALIQADKAHELLSSTYWFRDRSKEAVAKSIENSLCFGVYKDGVQVGLARAITDYAVTYFLCDVVIGESYRGLGLGKALVEAVTGHEILRNLMCWLATKDAHELYEKYGFERVEGKVMRRVADL